MTWGGEGVKDRHILDPGVRECSEGLLPGRVQDVSVSFSPSSQHWQCLAHSRCLPSQRLCSCVGKTPERVSWVVGGTRDVGAQQRGGPPWSSSRCGTRPWCKAPCHRPLCWGAAGARRRTPAHSLHPRCCRHSGPAGSSVRARIAQSTEGTRGTQAWASLASSPSSLSGASEPGWASDAWLRGYRASWAEEQAEYRACLSCLTVGGSYEISFVKVSADSYRVGKTAALAHWGPQLQDPPCPRASLPGATHLAPGRANLPVATEAQLAGLGDVGPGQVPAALWGH